ncbi:hypothetical protein AHAS_Ahas16G0229500 [Arachis hypogaea]
MLWKKLYIVWERILIDKKEESTSTDMSLGTAIHNIEITLENGGQLARAASAVRLIFKNCSATVEQVGNVGVNQKILGRARSKYWLGKRPVVRVVMNPADHPHGVMKGGPQLIEKKLATPWGYPALRRRSRKMNKLQFSKLYGNELL